MVTRNHIAAIAIMAASLAQAASFGVGTNLLTNVTVGTNLVQYVRVGTNLVWQRTATWTPASLSPVAWYKGDGNALDSGSAGQTAAWVGTETYSNGVNSQAFWFNGSSAINTQTNCIGGACMFAETNRAWTVAVWSYHVTGSGAYTFCRGSGTAASATLYLRRISITLRGTYNDIDDMPSEAWNHQAITWDGTTARYFTNGVYVGTLSVGTAAEETAQNIVIGGRVNGTVPSVTGKIDDTLLWNRALTTGEVAQVYGWRQ